MDTKGQDHNEQGGANLAAALLKAQASIQAVAKGSTNTFHKFAYVSGDDMVRDARVVLHDAGLVARRTGWQLGPAEGGGQIVTMTMRLDHPPSGEHFTDIVTLPAFPEKGRPIDKAVLGALTTGLAYWLRDLLLLPRVDENEVDRRDDRKYDPARTATQSKPESYRDRLLGLVALWTGADSKQNALGDFYRLAAAHGFTRDGVKPTETDFRNMLGAALAVREEDMLVSLDDHIDAVTKKRAGAGTPQGAPAPVTPPNDGLKRQLEASLELEGKKAATNGKAARNGKATVYEPT
jgi:hypothetical protein